MTYEEAFSISERLGRDIVIKEIEKRNGKWEETPDRFNPVDIYSTAATGDIGVIEVKYRDNYSSEQIESFKDGKGYLLEKGKYDSLMSIYEASGYTPIYWVILDDIQLVWDLRNISDLTVYSDPYPNVTVTEKKYTKYKDSIYLKRYDTIREYPREDKE